ncbi:nickel ABC transporter permease [Halalkalibacter nanhaiisediminis]|uniref:Nickel import system permease protein NikB n=1 Tax=Halalkalibacter nanhaiisediminis TaxID=688079 RepID=A0A562QBG3_9BACI|nr:nickel ABC transporter permease [Halalkalibacter nanhaiisediminis]TWI54105.1 peptide/nickel transport system permease protein [Halalkalibacter nanhaiisediminis]
MAKVIVSRVLQLIMVLFLLSIMTFGLMKLAPGDPVRTILKTDEVSVSLEELEALRKELQFDQPIFIQYTSWLSNVVRLDLGESYVSQQPVVKEIASRIVPTLYLTVGGLMVMTIVATALGTLSAVFKNSWIDHFSRLFAYIGASVPTFWLGLILIYLFSFKLSILPAMGEGSIKHLILPSLTLGLGMAAVYARLLRAGLLESFSQEYIRAARSRGLSEWQIVKGHALRSALLPVMTMFGMSFGYLLGGSVVVEMIFSYPGLGKMVVDAVFKRDYTLIQGYILFTGVVVVFINLLVDLSYRFLDPRIRFEKEGRL